MEYLSLAGAATSIIFVATNMCLPRQSSSFAAIKVCLSRQNYVCRDKRLLRSKRVFFSLQNLCLDKHTFVATKGVFCRDKHVLVESKLSLSRQNYVGATNTYCDKSFFTTKVLSRQAYFCRVKRRGLSRQTRVSRQNICRDKNDLVATPANDSILSVTVCSHALCRTKCWKVTGKIVSSVACCVT